MHQAKRRLRFITMSTALTGAMTLSLTLPATASAQPTTVDKTSTTTVTVVYEGLNGARKVTWDPRQNAMLVAEAGRSSAPCIGDDTNGCFTKTGAILAYRLHNNTGQRVVTGLPALVTGRGLAGISEVNPNKLTEYMTVFGLGGLSPLRDVHGPDAAALGQITRITPSGQAVPIVDLVAFEEQNNPDGGHVDSNPYGMVVDYTGAAVVDAAANDVLHFGRHGVSVLDVPPAVQYGNNLLEPVPAAITRAPGGGYYVGELGGSPFPMGEARVWRVRPGQPTMLVAGGFTNIIDLATDRQGRVLVLELAERGLASGNPAGRLVRIEPNGVRTVLATDGLVHPGGVDVAPNGDIYVTNRITGADGAGQLLRIRITC